MIMIRDAICILDGVTEEMIFVLMVVSKGIEDCTLLIHQVKLVKIMSRFSISVQSVIGCLKDEIFEKSKDFWLEIL